MDKVSNSYNQKTIGYRDNINKNPIDYRKEMTSKQADAIIAQALDMIDDQKFKPYFYKTLYIIGPTNFYEALDNARKADADCRSCIFVKRLKELRNQHEPKRL